MIGDLLTTAGATLTAEAEAALAVAIPFGLTVLGAVIGWKLLKRFVKA